MTEHEVRSHCLDSGSVTREMDFDDYGVRWLVVTCHCQECGNRWKDHYAHNWSESLDD